MDLKITAIYTYIYMCEIIFSLPIMQSQWLKSHVNKINIFLLFESKPEKKKLPLLDSG